jgi:hypothetical protein
MDPDTALANAREAAADYDKATSISQENDAAERLVEAFQALDQWLSRDGFLPADWRSDDEKAEDEDPTIRCRDCEHPLHHRPEKALSGETQMVWADQHDSWVCDETGNEHRPGVRA